MAYGAVCMHLLILRFENPWRVDLCWRVPPVPTIRLEKTASVWPAEFSRDHNGSIWEHEGGPKGWNLTMFKGNARDNAPGNARGNCRGNASGNGPTPLP